MLGQEHDRVGPVLLVARQGRVARHRLPARAAIPARQVLVALAEAGLGERARDLAHPVGPEVERDHAVARAYARLLPDQRRLDELVCLTARIGLLDGCLARVGVERGAAVHEHVVGALGSLPAPVSVHRPVAPDDRADAGVAAGVELAQVLDAGMRERVAAVGEGVDHQLSCAELDAEVDQRAQMLER